MSTNTNNILLINKPKHWTSNDVVRKVKKILHCNKVGHAGTLDPLASGLLILGIDNGTKQLNEILSDTKTYVATIHLNYFTETYDSEGTIVAYEYQDIGIDQIKVQLEFFRNNNYYQLPPKYSAIKINGKKAYDLARTNQAFVLEPRLVKLIDYKIISYIDKQLIIELTVSKGFYVRSFAYDLGQKLGNYANLANLVRTQIGDYKLVDAYELKDLNDTYNQRANK